jgi:hypothetical protein
MRHVALSCVLFILALSAPSLAGNVELGNSGWRWISGDAYTLTASWEVDVINNTNLSFYVDAQCDFLDGDGYIVGSDYAFNQFVRPGHNMLRGQRSFWRTEASQIHSASIRVSQSVTH